jgi:hypothetical protein
MLTGVRMAYYFAGFALDLDLGSLSRAGETRNLRPKNLEMLKVFLEYPGRLYYKGRSPPECVADVVASHLGYPDAGLATYSDMVGRVRQIVEGTATPLIADGDTGYGGLLNVDLTVRGYEASGAQAIQLEDQEFPKKCGHTPSRRVIPLAEAARKIKVAAKARSSKDFKIIARTARPGVGNQHYNHAKMLPQVRAALDLWAGHVATPCAEKQPGANSEPRPAEATSKEEDCHIAHDIVIPAAQAVSVRSAKPVAVRS